MTLVDGSNDFMDFITWNTNSTAFFLFQMTLANLKSYIDIEESLIRGISRHHCKTTDTFQRWSHDDDAKAHAGICFWLSIRSCTWLSTLIPPAVVTKMVVNVGRPSSMQGLFLVSKDENKQWNQYSQTKFINKISICTIWQKNWKWLSTKQIINNYKYMSLYCMNISLHN